MAPHRIRTALTCLLALCFARAVQGSGDWDEEEPPTLSATIDQLPAKSFGSIFEETAPLPPAPPSPGLAFEVDKIADRIGKDTPDALAKDVEGLLKRARLEAYNSGDWCNLLEDTLDVVKASSKDAAAARSYLHWRVEHRDWFGFPPQNTDDTDFDPHKVPAPTDQQKAELKRLAEASTGPIKAHWIYLQGAILFASGDREACRDWFALVVKDFPGHPRAEAAQFLLARCDLVRSRAENLSATDRKAAQKTAAESFMQFRRDHPGGRFDADALGWLGAIAYDTGDSMSALKYYIAQIEDAAHPEVRKSAVFMCEKTLSGLNPDEDNSEEFALIAQHPAVAMGYMYQVLNTPDPVSDDPNAQAGDSANMKKWRRKILPLIAAQVAKQHELYKADDWQPRYLALLAQAASESGDQAQALQITGVAADEINRSDDLLFARGLALQRAGRAADAIAAYRTLLKKFPESPLREGVRLRLALALQDNHQAGDAVVVLRALGIDLKTVAPEGAAYQFSDGSPPDYELKSTDSVVYANITGADGTRVREMIDTLLNYAPLPELAESLDDRDFDDASKSEMRAVIAERYLAAEDFTNAKKYMTEAQYGLLAAKLEALTRAAMDAPAGKEQAEKFAAVGDAWAAARGQLLLLPLDGAMGASRIMGDKDDSIYLPEDLLGRRENGAALGFPDTNTELENRDELRHASRWWMRAARESPGSAVDASARLKALEAMPKIAALTSYAETRARETHAGEASREIYDRLVAECPDSAEAKRIAAYWDFPLPVKDQNGNENLPLTGYAAGEEERDLNIMGYEYDDYGAFGVKWEDIDYGDDKDWGEVEKRIMALPGLAAKSDVAQVAKEVDKLTALAHTLFLDTSDVSSINFLDDLSLFVHEKAVTPRILQAYLKLRTDVLGRTFWGYSEPANPLTDDDVAAEIDKAMKDPALKPVEDYLACTRLAMLAARQIQVQTGVPDDKGSDDGNQNPGAPAEGFTYSSRDYAGMEKQAREFLQKYPRSNKREAVMFVLARSVQGLSRAHVCYVGMRSPGTGKDDHSFVDTERIFRQEPFSAKRVLAPLDAYDKEFPKGRYSADILDYRAYVAWQTRDWGRALDMTLSEMGDKSQPDLQTGASLRLAAIFAELADKDQRPNLMDAIRARPAALSRLKEYLAAVPANPGHPLRYMQDFLADKLPLPAK